MATPWSSIVGAEKFWKKEVGTYCTEGFAYLFPNKLVRLTCTVKSTFLRNKPAFRWKGKQIKSVMPKSLPNEVCELGAKCFKNVNLKTNM